MRLYAIASLSANQKYSTSGRRRLALFPRALRSLDNHALLDCRGRDSDVTHFSIDKSFDPLKVGHEAAFGDCGHVCADTTAFLGFTTAPNNAALHRALAGQFTNSCHKDPVSS